MNGEEALSIILDYNQDKKFFDVILLDLNMPVMDGSTTIHELKLLESKGVINLSETKIFALSAIAKE